MSNQKPPAEPSAESNATPEKPDWISALDALAEKIEQKRKRNRIVSTEQYTTLQMVIPRLRANQLTTHDREILLEILTDILDDRDPRERYWLTARGAPPVDYEKKLLAVMKICRLTKSPTEEEYEQIADHFGLTADVVKHAWRDASTAKRAKRQRNK